MFFIVRKLDWDLADCPSPVEFHEGIYASFVDFLTWGCRSLSYLALVYSEEWLKVI